MVRAGFLTGRPFSIWSAPQIGVQRQGSMVISNLRVLAVMLVLVMSAPAAAGEQTFIAAYRDWSLSIFRDGEQEICFIASEPTKQDGNYERRGPPAVLVTRVPEEPDLDEVSVQPGYTFQAGSEVVVVVDGADEFRLFTQGEYAWTRGPAADDALIASMRAGLQMTVRGTSTRGTWSLDTYSLLGFTAAMNAMSQRCTP